MGWKKRAKGRGVVIVCPETYDNYKRAGALPIYFEKDDPYIILISEQTRPGMQVAKGHREKGDGSLFETAIREVSEEAGLEGRINLFDGHWSKKGIYVKDKHEPFPFFLVSPALMDQKPGREYSHYDRFDDSTYTVHQVRAKEQDVDSLMPQLQKRYRGPLEFVLKDVVPTLRSK